MGEAQNPGPPPAPVAMALSDPPPSLLPPDPESDSDSDGGLYARAASDVPPEELYDPTAAAWAASTVQEQPESTESESLLPPPQSPGADGGSRPMGGFDVDEAWYGNNMTQRGSGSLRVIVINVEGVAFNEIELVAASWAQTMRFSRAHVAAITELRITRGATERLLIAAADRLGYHLAIAAVPEGADGRNAQGVALMTSNLSPMQDISLDPAGRAAIATLDVTLAPTDADAPPSTTPQRVAAIYGPAGATARTFDDNPALLLSEDNLKKFLTDDLRRHPTVARTHAGDFNAIADPDLDTKSDGRAFRERSLVAKHQADGFTDTFRALHPHQMGLTFLGSVGGSRLLQIWTRPHRDHADDPDSDPFKPVAAGILIAHLGGSAHLPALADLGVELDAPHPAEKLKSPPLPKIFARFRHMHEIYDEAEQDPDCLERLVIRIDAAARAQQRALPDDRWSVARALEEVRALHTVACGKCDEGDELLNDMCTEAARGMITRAYDALAYSATDVVDRMLPRYPPTQAEADAAGEADGGDAAAADELTAWVRAASAAKSARLSLELARKLGSQSAQQHAAEATAAVRKALGNLHATAQLQRSPLRGMTKTKLKRIIPYVMYPRSPGEKQAALHVESALRALREPEVESHGESEHRSPGSQTPGGPRHSPPPNLATILARVVDTISSRRYKAKMAERSELLATRRIADWVRQAGLPNRKSATPATKARPAKYMAQWKAADGSTEHYEAPCTTDAQRAESLSQESQRVYTKRFVDEGMVTSPPSLQLLQQAAPCGLAMDGVHAGRHHTEPRWEFKQPPDIAWLDLDRAKHDRHPAMATLEGLFRKFPHGAAEPHPSHQWHGAGSPRVWLDVESHPLLKLSAIFAHKPGSHPGISSFKRFYLKHFPPEWQELYQLLLSLCMAIGVVPDSTRLIPLFALGKPDGGTRFIAFLEEFLKQIDTCVQHDINAARYENMDENFLSPHNAAYRRGCGTQSVLPVVWAAVDSACRNNTDIFLTNYDLLKFFDTIIWPLVESILRLMHCPEPILRLLAEIAAGTAHAVITPYGLSDWYLRHHGGPQGRPTLCIVALAILEPIYLTLDAMHIDPSAPPAPPPPLLAISPLLTTPEQMTRPLPDHAFDVVRVRVADLHNIFKGDALEELAQQAAAGEFAGYIVSVLPGDPTRAALFPVSPRGAQRLAKPAPLFTPPDRQQEAEAWLAAVDEAHAREATGAAEASERPASPALKELARYHGHLISAAGHVERAYTVAAAAARPAPSYRPFVVTDKATGAVTVCYAKAYCDDGASMAADFESQQAEMDIIAGGSLTLDLGLKLKGSTAHSTSARHAGWRLVVPKFFDVFKGGDDSGHITVAPPHALFRALGATRNMRPHPFPTPTSGGNPNFLVAKAKISRTLPHMARRRFRLAEMVMGLRMVTYPTITYAALVTALDVMDELMSLDKSTAIAAASAISAASTLSPSFFFAKAPVGAGAHSLVAEFMAVTARELQRVLLGDQLAGQLARAEWSDFALADPRRHPAAIIPRAVMQLAQFGIYVRSAHEDLLNRFLDALAEELAPPPHDHLQEARAARPRGQRRAVPCSVARGVHSAHSP